MHNLYFLFFLVLLCPNSNAFVGNRFVIPGSEPKLDSVNCSETLDEDVVINISVVVRLAEDPNRENMLQSLNTNVNGFAPKFSDEELDSLFGGGLDDINEVVSFFESEHWTLIKIDHRTRIVKFSAPVSSVNQIFNVTLLKCSHADGKVYYAHTNPLHIPETIYFLIDFVVGLSDVPVMTRKHSSQLASKHHQKRLTLTNQAYFPSEVASLFDLPINLKGDGECVGIVEFAGGFDMSDLQYYYSIRSKPMPNIKTVCVDDYCNPGYTGIKADNEVSLDIEIVGEIVPQATIVVYFGKNSYQGMIDVYNAVVSDTTSCNNGKHLSTVSISWGDPESSTNTYFDRYFQLGAAQGITLVAASGDKGSTDSSTSKASVDYPASSPYVLAVGGTSLYVNGNQIIKETVWNSDGGASGGGKSKYFSRPAWQLSKYGDVALTTRGVPDVAALADPLTGYQIYNGGQWYSIGGTSAAAPLWAAYVALMDQYFAPNKLGFINPLLYSLGSQSIGFQDIVEGNNSIGGLYPFYAQVGWDACTGWGRPKGLELMFNITFANFTPPPYPPPPADDADITFGSPLFYIILAVVAGAVLVLVVVVLCCYHPRNKNADTYYIQKPVVAKN